MPASEKAVTNTATKPLQQSVPDNSRRLANDNLASITGSNQRPVEEMVVNINNKAKASTQTEQGIAVNEAIQESQLTSGEIAIDRLGLIHHSKDDDVV